MRFRRNQSQLDRLLHDPALVCCTPADWEDRKAGGPPAAVHGRLHFLFRDVDVQREVELRVMTELPNELVEVICRSPGICPNYARAAQ